MCNLLCVCCVLAEPMSTESRGGARECMGSELLFEMLVPGFVVK
jgi:hypothetical protein